MVPLPADALSVLRSVSSAGPSPSSQGCWPLGVSHQLPLMQQDPLLHGLGQQIKLGVIQHWGWGAFGERVTKSQMFLSPWELGDPMRREL